MMIKRFLNPIARFDSKKLLITGLLSMALNVLMGYFFQLKMVSVLKFADSPADLKILMLSCARAYLVAMVVLYLYGFIINRKTRFLDIVNTVFIGVIPLILVSPLNRLPFFEAVLQRTMENPQDVSVADLTVLLVFTAVMIPPLVYMVVLLFNGFKTATNLKAWYHVVLFFVLLLAVATYTPYLFKW